jgi:sulfur carrier protein ThiS
MSARATRVALASLLLPIMGSPAISLADSTDAMDACVQAFLASEIAKDRTVVVEKDFESVPRPLALAGLYQIEVVATGRDSGKQVARVVCHADAKGTIVALNGKPRSALAAVAQTH